MISGFAVAVIPALLLPWLLLSLRSPILFAVLPVAPLAIVYARAIRRGAAGRAAALALTWALALSVSTVAAAAHSPGEAMRGIWRAGAYRDEMLLWIGTGVGSEGSPALFLPRVLLEYAVTLLLPAVTAGAGGLLLGSALLGYMNGYVGWVLAHAAPDAAPWRAALIAWPPWAMARVASFVLGATAASSWGYARVFERGGPRRPVSRGLLLGSLGLLALDVALKWALAPEWRGLLATLLGASAGIEAGAGS